MAQSSYRPSEYVHMYPELIQTFLAGQAVDHYANEPAPSTSSQFERLSNHYQYMTFAAEFRDFVRTRSELQPHTSPIFFTWFFLGSLFNLADSGIMSALNTRDVFIKQSAGVIRVAYGSTSASPKNPVTLHFRTIWMPGSQSSAADRGMFSASELTELVYKWNLDFFALNKIDIDTKYLEFTRGSNLFPQDFDVIWSTQAKDHTRHLLHMICKNKLTDEMFYRPFNLENPAFAMVTVKDRESDLVKMKSLFEALQSTNVESVRTTIAQILQNFHETYITYKKGMNLVANAEAYVGYITGIFVLNYQKRFNLKCDIKLLAIHEKIIFSVLPTYRLNARLSSNVPIIFESIEFQSKPSIRLRQLKQSGMRELLPSFNTDSKLAVLAITNFDLVKTESQTPIRVATVEINQGIVYKFLNIYEYSMSANEDHGECARFLNMELSHLIGQMGQVKSSLVSAHIYGQILSLPTNIEKHIHGFEVAPEEEKVSKFFYKYDNPVLASEINTFMVIHGSNMITFNIGLQSSRHEFTDAFFSEPQNNLFILPEGVRAENILHINVHLDNMQGSFIHLKRVVPRELTADHSTIHNGLSTHIADLPVAKLFEDLKSKRIDDVKEVLSRCLFQDRFLFIDSLHIKAVLKGVFTSKMMSMSALEQNSGSIVIVLHQELPRLSRDYSLREMLASPMSSDNVLLNHSPVMIKISTKFFQPEDRRAVVDKTVVGFWVEYFTSMTFPKEEAQPILFPLVFNPQADEPGQLMEGAIFTPDEGLENVVSDVKSVLDSVCHTSRRKRHAVCSFTESELEELGYMDGRKEWKVDSEKFSEFATSRDRQTVEGVLKYMVLKNAKVTGSKADQLRSLITNSKALSRLNKVSKYANIGTMGLIAKDIISAVARGNYTEAATTSVSSVFGPVGAVVGALVFLGTNIYSSVKIVDRIDHVVRLTTGERIAEGFRAFFGMTPEEHVRILMERKERYGRQVDAANEFLKNQTRIRNYYFPMQKHDGKMWREFDDNFITRPQTLHYSNLTLNLFGITKIMARPNLADQIFLDCDTEFVDSGNGKDDQNRDFIKVPDKMCFFETLMKLGKFTVVQNDAIFGHFEYTIEQGPVVLKFGHSSLANHKILFNEPLTGLTTLESADFLILRFENGMHVQLHGYKFAKCSLFFSENVELRYDTHGNTTHFHGYGSSNHTALDVLKIFTAIADKLNIAFTVKSKINNETIFISHKNDHMVDKNQTSNILHNDPFAITYIRENHYENKEYEKFDILIDSYKMKIDLSKRELKPAPIFVDHNTTFLILNSNYVLIGQEYLIDRNICQIEFTYGETGCLILVEKVDISMDFRTPFYIVLENFLSEPPHSALKTLKFQFKNKIVDMNKIKKQDINDVKKFDHILQPYKDALDNQIHAFIGNVPKGKPTATASSSCSKTTIRTRCPIMHPVHIYENVCGHTLSTRNRKVQGSNPGTSKDLLKIILIVIAR
uniref:Apolipoprotein B n=1 Tax=Romanomermis culicivorax TaxID=13658 RepID=A0A915JTS3_ROMCU